MSEPRRQDTGREKQNAEQARYENAKFNQDMQDLAKTSAEGRQAKQDQLSKNLKDLEEKMKRKCDKTKKK